MSGRGLKATKTLWKGQLAMVTAAAFALASCGKSDKSESTADYATRAAEAVSQNKISKSCLPTAAPKPDAAYVAVAHPSKELVAAAAKEGQLVLNAAITDTTSITALQTAFHLRYPDIKISVAEGGSASLEERFLADHAAGNQQVDAEISTKFKFIERAFKDKAIDPLDKTVPGILKTWPEGEWRWVTAYGTTAVPFYRPLGIGYNSDQVKGSLIPKQYIDLANPAFKGHVLALDPEASTTYSSVWKHIWQVVGDEGMKAIGNNLQKKPLYSDIQVASQALGAGGGMVIMQMGKNVSATMKNSGAPVEAVIPDVVTGPAYGFGAAVDAPHPNAAKVFGQWLYSPEAQWVIACTAYMGTVAYPTHGVKKYVPFDTVSKEEMAKMKSLLGI